MGCSADLNKLRIQGDELRENQDVKGDLANAKATMDATATVQSAQQTGMMVNMNQGFQVNLLVMTDGIPIPVRIDSSR